jgi:hypothetical protein
MKIHKNVKFDEVEEQIAETLKHAPAQKDGPKYKRVIYFIISPLPLPGLYQCIQFNH